MNTDDLSLLLAVAEARSMSAVAKLRGTAVSTVARRIDGLESLLKLRLVDRRRDGIVLTADGLRIAAAAKTVVDGAQMLDRVASAMRHGSREKSSCRAPSSSSPKSSPRALAGYWAISLI